jgi:pimeloyl-ACP methyl ester carboxylesterase
MRKRFLRDGFNVIVISLDWQTLSDGVRGLYRMSEILSSVVLRLRKKTGMGKRPKVFLVAHSAGGLVARYYVQLLGGSHYCDGLITLGTPHSGTWMAALGFLSHLILKARCLFQMLPISPFIRRINHAPFPNGFKMISIFSTDDLMCPRRATQLPPWLSNREGIESVEVANVSHSEFLLSKEPYQILLRHLRPDPPPKTAPVPLAT